MKASEFIETEVFKEMLKEFDLELEDFTCYYCGSKEACPSSYDPYNINYDCLEEK